MYRRVKTFPDLGSSVSLTVATNKASFSTYSGTRYFVTFLIIRLVLEMESITRTK
jgi:hypothetical protein